MTITSTEGSRRRCGEAARNTGALLDPVNEVFFQSFAANVPHGRGDEPVTQRLVEDATRIVRAVPGARVSSCGKSAAVWD